MGYTTGGFSQVPSRASSPAPTWRPSPRLGVAATLAEAQQAGDALPPGTMALLWCGKWELMGSMITDFFIGKLWETISFAD